MTKKKAVVLPRGGADRGQGRKPYGEQAMTELRSVRLSPETSEAAERILARSGESFNALVTRLIVEANKGRRKAGARPGLVRSANTNARVVSKKRKTALRLRKSA